MTAGTLTILGATGYTGRLCVAEAVSAGWRVRLAGRRREALDELAAEHGSADLSVVVVDATEADQLRRVTDDTDVLLSTVGPYSELGRLPVEAALDAGCAYLDVSGETDFLSWVYAQDERAKERGVALAPGVGFDGVPGDLLAAVAARTLDRPVVSVRIAYAGDNVRISSGTARSALGVAARGGAVWRNGRVAQEPAGTDYWHVQFPPPFGARGTLSIPLPEVVTVGRSTGADVVRSFFAVPGARTLAGIAGPGQRVAALLAATPAWRLVDKAIDRLPDGPAPEDRRATHMAILAEVGSADGVTVTRWATVRDVYATTATIAVAAARQLVEGDFSGVLTPSQVFDADELLGQIAERVGP